MLQTLATAYVLVLVAELVGDKLIYTAGSLTTRFRALPVFCGLSLAFMLKMLAAVSVGRFIAELPGAVVAGVSAVTFFAAAAVIWFRRDGGEETPKAGAGAGWWRAVGVSFAAAFLTEWGDIGQLTAATLAARHNAPLVVWFGATLALMTKGALAVTLGVGLRRKVPARILRPLAASVCVVMGFVSAHGAFR